MNKRVNKTEKKVDGPTQMSRRRPRSRGRSFSVAGQKRFWGDKQGQGNKRILLGGEDVEDDDEDDNEGGLSRESSLCK